MNDSTRYRIPKQSIEDEAFWKKHIEMQTVSKRSKSAYCRANKVDYVRFIYWSKKIAPNPPVGGLMTVKVRPETNPLLCQTILCTLPLKEGDCLHVYDERALSIILEKRC